MLFYGVVDGETEQVVEFFLTHSAADGFIREVRRDEPKTAALLRLEPVEFHSSISPGRRG